MAHKSLIFIDRGEPNIYLNLSRNNMIVLHILIINFHYRGAECPWYYILKPILSVSSCTLGYVNETGHFYLLQTHEAILELRNSNLSV